MFDVGKYVLNEDADNVLDMNRQKHLTFILEAPYIVSTNSGEGLGRVHVRPSLCPSEMTCSA